MGFNLLYHWCGTWVWYSLLQYMHSDWRDESNWALGDWLDSWPSCFTLPYNDSCLCWLPNIAESWLNDKGGGGGLSYTYLVDPSITLKRGLVVEIVQRDSQATISLILFQHWPPFSCTKGLLRQVVLHRHIKPSANWLLPSHRLASSSCLK